MVDARYFQCPAPNLTKLAKSVPVTVKIPVSYSYNGGTVIDGKWYCGYEVPKPIIPMTHELVGMGVGLQLNARPPYATMILRPKNHTPHPDA